MGEENESAKKRNGQTNPLLRKLNAARENGGVLPQSGDGGSKRAANSCQLSALSGQQSALGTQRSALSTLHSAGSGELPVVLGSSVDGQSEELGEEWVVLNNVKCEGQIDGLDLLVGDPLEVMQAQVGE